MFMSTREYSNKNTRPMTKAFNCNKNIIRLRRCIIINCSNYKTQDQTELSAIFTINSKHDSTLSASVTALLNQHNERAYYINSGYSDTSPGHFPR